MQVTRIRRLSRRAVSLATGLAAVLVLGGAAAPGAGAPEDTIRARQRFFGAENVDSRTARVRRDRVVLSWIGSAGYAAAFNGHVVLLDAWVPRGHHHGYVPTTVSELVALDPVAIFVGHGHFDHAADAAAIASATGAVVVGTQEHCESVRGDATEQGLDLGTIRCRVVMSASEDAVGTAVGIDLLPGVATTALRHVHSPSRPLPPDLSDCGGPHAPLHGAPAPGNVVAHPPAPEMLLGQLQDIFIERGGVEGGSLLYRFEVGRFSLVWHDTVGALPEEAPHLVDVLRRLPPTDVQIGAIAGTNQLSNGLRDIRQYIEAIAPRVFVPSHHDDVHVVHGTTAETYRQPLAEELQRLPEDRRPAVTFPTDPGDYIRPELLTFDVRSPRWVGDEMAVRPPARCPDSTTPGLQPAFRALRGGLGSR